MVPLLQNKQIIGVSQDPMGAMGSMIQAISTPTDSGGLEICLVAIWLALYTDPSVGTFFNVTQPLDIIGWIYRSAQVYDLYNEAWLSPVVYELPMTVGPNFSSFVLLSPTC